MKVLLLNPDTGREERIESKAAWPPLGLLYMGTLLQKSGHEVKVIDNARSQLPVEDVVARVSKESPEVVGLSALTPTFKQAVKIAKSIKEKNPHIKVVFGNYHATFEYERLLRNYPAVDYVVIGEGEITFLELVKTMENGGKINDVKGIALRHDGRVITTPPRTSIQELDELPFPDRTLLEQEYHSEIVWMLGSGEKFTTMLTSRGCPYACKYCACSAFSSRTARFRSPENVAAEMELLQREGYEEVGFVDDNLLLNKTRNEKIFELVKARKIKLNLWAEGRVDQASKETLRCLSRTGCKTIYFGIESGTERVLEYYGKKITPEQSRRAVSNSKRAGIENVIGSFIIGAPIETADDVKTTFDFALSLRGMDFPQMNILYLSPGMELWNEAVKGGYINEDEHWESPVAATKVLPSQLREEELSDMINAFYKGFIERPSYLLSQLLKTMKSEYRLKILLANLKAGTNFSAIRHLWGR